MKKIKLFYLEDELSLGKIVKESLESRDFEVKMIANGLSAIDEFISFNPDVCVLDVMLPHKDGFTIGNEIRALNKDIPILYLTAKNQTEDVLKGFASGGNDYIRKPFSMEELIVRIKNLLGLRQSEFIKKQKEENSESVLIGKYTFFPLRQELFLQNTMRRLSHRETELLSIFARNINKAVSRKFILVQIWGNDSIFNSRNLDVYINKLREYLKEDPEVELITLKGVGYRLIG